MQTAKKLDQTPAKGQQTSRLESLLLDKDYTKQYSSKENFKSAQEMDSRIEAEYQLEKIFKNMV